MFFVYKITNTLNNKVYVGKSNNIEKRWNQHKRASRYKNLSRFHKAIKEFGVSNFTIQKISENELEIDSLSQEKIYIKNYNSTDPSCGYNMTNGGQGISGFKHSEKTRKILSEIRKKERLIDKEKYDNLNALQCKVPLTICNLIKSEALENSRNYIMQKFNVSRKTLIKILTNKYSILKNEPEIKLPDRTVHVDIKQKIIEDYKSGSLIKELIIKYNVSSSTITRLFRDNGIKAKSGFSVCPPKNKSHLTDEQAIKIKEMYSTGDYSYSELGKVFNVSKQIVAKIIQGRTRKYL